MKLEVHTLRWGTADWMDACVPTLEAWCKRHGYKLIVWDDTDRGYPCPKFCEIDMVRSFLAGESTHMIYVDADVWVHPDAPAFLNFDSFLMAGDVMHDGHEQHWIDWCRENYKIEVKGPYQNAGVWATGRSDAKRLISAMESLPMVECFQEQHWFNLAVHEACMSRFNLPPEWNRYGRSFEPAWFHPLWGERKMDDLGALRYSGVLDRKPDDLRYCFDPGHYPHEDKALVLQFVKGCGLGNQMFELAAGLGIARRLGIPLRWNWNPTQKRDFGLTHFGLGALPFREYPVVSSRLGQGNTAIVEAAVQAVHDSTHRFPAISHPFQAEECFKNVADEVRELFKLDPLMPVFPEGRTPVAVQVRRGDYIKHPRLDVVTEAYFLNAMDFMRQRIRHPQFIFVSDDPLWCSQKFAHLPDTLVMPPQSAIDGLRTMAACEAHVISNSTYGWWGAWLAEKGPVVVPEIWHHRPGSYGKWKPAPDRWHRVPITRGVAARPVQSLPVPPSGFKEFPREYERAIVIPWHADQDRWQSLRYCLRSIHANFTDKSCPIVILGTRRPAWLIFGKHRVRFIEAWSYQDALMRGVQIADEVLWMNDDILLLKPTGWDDCRRPLHFGPVTPEFLKDFEVRPNPWRDGFRRMVERLTEAGQKVVNNYSTHVPYFYRAQEAIETIKRFGIHHKAPFEGYYFNTHAGASAKRIGDERATGVPFGDARFLNHTDHRLVPELKEAIKAAFPDFAPWELKAEFDA